MPQLSAAVTVPQFLPSRVQNAAGVSLVQPQTFGVPPPPQVCGAEHIPQDPIMRGIPQRSRVIMPPQLAPRLEQSAVSLSGTQNPAVSRVNRWLLPEPQVCCWIWVLFAVLEPVTSMHLVLCWAWSWNWFIPTLISFQVWLLAPEHPHWMTAAPLLVLLPLTSAHRLLLIELTS